MANPILQFLDSPPGTSVVTFARSLGVSRQSVYRWLDGTAWPKYTLWPRIARLYGKSGLSEQVLARRKKV